MKNLSKNQLIYDFARQFQFIFLWAFLTYLQMIFAAPYFAACEKKLSIREQELAEITSMSNNLESALLEQNAVSFTNCIQQKWKEIKIKCYSEKHF